jgi:hypothetical protein
LSGNLFGKPEGKTTTKKIKAQMEKMVLRETGLKDVD